MTGSFRLIRQEFCRMNIYSERIKFVHFAPIARHRRCHSYRNRVHQFGIENEIINFVFVVNFLLSINVNSKVINKEGYTYDYYLE